MLGYVPKGMEVSLLQRCLHTPVFVALFPMAKLWNQHRCPSAEDAIETILLRYENNRLASPEGKKKWIEQKVSGIFSHIQNPFFFLRHEGLDRLLSG